MPLRFSDDMATEISTNSRNTFVWYAGCIPGHGSVRSGRWVLFDLARLSPLSHKHFNMLGRYHFAVPEEVLRGELRPLRDLNDADEELLIA